MSPVPSLPQLAQADDPSCHQCLDVLFSQVHAGNAGNGTSYVERVKHILTEAANKGWLRDKEFCNWARVAWSNLEAKVESELGSILHRDSVLPEGDTDWQPPACYNNCNPLLAPLLIFGSWPVKGFGGLEDLRPWTFRHLNRCGIRALINATDVAFTDIHNHKHIADSVSSDRPKHDSRSKQTIWGKDSDDLVQLFERRAALILLARVHLLPNSHVISFSLSSEASISRCAQRNGLSWTEVKLEQEPPQFSRTPLSNLTPSIPASIWILTGTDQSLNALKSLSVSYNLPRPPAPYITGNSIVQPVTHPSSAVIGKGMKRFMDTVTLDYALHISTIYSNSAHTAVKPFYFSSLAVSAMHLREMEDWKVLDWLLNKETREKPFSMSQLEELVGPEYALHLQDLAEEYDDWVEYTAVHEASSLSKVKAQLPYDSPLQRAKFSVYRSQAFQNATTAAFISAPGSSAVLTEEGDFLMRSHTDEKQFRNAQIKTTEYLPAQGGASSMLLTEEGDFILRTHREEESYRSGAAKAATVIPAKAPAHSAILTEEGDFVLRAQTVEQSYKGRQQAAATESYVAAAVPAHSAILTEEGDFLLRGKQGENISGAKSRQAKDTENLVIEDGLSS